MAFGRRPSGLSTRCKLSEWAGGPKPFTQKPFTQAALSNRSKISLFDHLVGERGHPELGARLSAHPLVRATSADMLVFSFAKRARRKIPRVVWRRVSLTLRRGNEGALTCLLTIASGTVAASIAPTELNVFAPLQPK